MLIRGFREYLGSSMASEFSMVIRGFTVRNILDSAAGYPTYKTRMQSLNGNHLLA